MGWYSKQQMARSRVFHAWNREQRAQTRSAICEIVLFGCIYFAKNALSESISEIVWKRN